MKWKDTGEMVDKEDSSQKEDNFNEEQFSPWADQKRKFNRPVFSKIPILVLLVTAIVALIGILHVLIRNGENGAGDSQQLAAFNARLQKLEERLDKFEEIDKKVLRIWEQAKSFEKFKDRFDRSEASTSLRMDHLTMSLEALQKQIAKGRLRVGKSGKSGKSAKKPIEKNTDKAQYHKVQTGDTLYGISRKYQLNLDQLLKLNQMNPGSVILPGQKLIVRRPSK